MHNLETSIAEWRKAMLAAPGASPETVDELEGHLRENVQQLVRSGVAEPEAFQRAVAQLGAARAVMSEFQKLEHSTWLPVKVVTGIGLIVAIGAAVVLLAKLDVPARQLLLAAHAFTVTLGYSATFLAGGLGICFVAQRSFSDFSPFRIDSLRRVSFLLGSMAASFTIIGVVLGMIWAKAAWGRYWAWDAKEVGGFSMIVWQICFLLAHRFPQQTGHGVLVMSVLGNIVVGLAWFGVNRIAGPTPPGTLFWSLILAAVVFNVALFLAGLAPAGWLRVKFKF